ncbi:MAG: hypothetical protein EOO60_07535 [Hymenobacter sp.]|nr:MAG: hypothetical protein EOO60_07535 [Hymenobacter sp.]
MFSLFTTTDNLMAVPSIAGPRPTATNRNATIDLFRLVASFGVVAIHVHNSTQAAQGVTDFFWPLCVPFFYAVSLLYFVAGLGRTPVATVFARAGVRLLVPYLAWTGIYTGLLLAKQVVLGGEHTFVWWRILLYGESAVHLYFLPTLLLLQALALAFWLLLFAGAKLNHYLGGATLLAGAGAYLAWGIAHQCFGVAAIGEVLAIAAYLGLAFWLAPQLARPRRRWDLAGPGLLMAGIAVAVNMLGYTFPVLGYPLVLPIGGIGLLLVGFGLPRPTLPAMLMQVSAWSFGIYLSHVVFLEAFELLTKRVFPPIGLHYDWTIKLAVVTLIFTVAAGFTWLASQIGIGRWLLLGERS